MGEGPEFRACSRLIVLLTDDRQYCPIPPNIFVAICTARAPHAIHEQMAKRRRDSRETTLAPQREAGLIAPSAEEEE